MTLDPLSVCVMGVTAALAGFVLFVLAALRRGTVGWRVLLIGGLALTGLGATLAARANAWVVGPPLTLGAVG